MNDKILFIRKSKYFEHCRIAVHQCRIIFFKEGAPQRSRVQHKAGTFVCFTHFGKHLFMSPQITDISSDGVAMIDMNTDKRNFTRDRRAVKLLVQMFEPMVSITKCLLDVSDGKFRRAGSVRLEFRRQFGEPVEIFLFVLHAE
jgi:hypothetical protein